MRRATSKREARSLFFLGFLKEKKPLHCGSCERVRCLLYFLDYVCLIVCQCNQHRNRPLMSTALNAHGTNASPEWLCARTNTNEAFSCWSCCKAFRVGRARRRQRVFLEAWLGRVSKAWNVPGTSTSIMYHHNNGGFSFWKKILPTLGGPECVPFWPCP